MVVAVEHIFRSRLSTAVLLLALLGFCMVESLGQVARWDLLDQLSMADNLVRGGSFYPSVSSNTPFGVSVYFPGVAALSAVIEHLGIEYYATEVLLLLSCLIFLMFLCLLSITVRNLFEQHVTTFDFLIVSIIYIFLFCPIYLRYALEFKPDTIAFCAGLAALWIGNFWRADTPAYRSILGGLMFGAALIFKQQFAGFLMGSALFAVYRPHSQKTLFNICAGIAAFGVIALVHSSRDAWYWTVTVLADDGFSLDGIASVSGLAKAALVLVAFAFFLYRARSIPESGLDPRRLLENPWTWLAAPAFLFAMLSAVKVGGGIGNIQLGLMFLLPYFFVISRAVDRRILLALALIASLYHFRTLPAAIAAYNDAVALKRAVEAQPLPPNGGVLTGSDVYYATRALAGDAAITNYWTMALKDNVAVDDKLRDYVARADPDLIVVENWPQNEAWLKSSGEFQLVWKNGLGLVARRAR